MTRLRVVALACALIVPGAVIGDELLHLSLSADAQRCCASTGGDCASLRSPDACCQTQQKAATTTYTAVAPKAGTKIDGQLALALLAEFQPVSNVRTLSVPHAGEQFKRPHDPPHLHAFPLLI